jgi:hypothetical protein
MSAQLKEEWPIDAGPEPTPERTGQISAALAKAQAEMQNPAFDTTNPHFKSRFASLAAVRNATVPVLAKHGIAMSQNLTSGDNSVACTTILMHASGQRLSFGPLVLPVAKADAQGFGSAATYARRYSLMAVCGVVGDDDDDGNAAVVAKPQLTVEPISPDVWTALAEAAAQGEAALRDQWKRLSEKTRAAIMDGHGQRWETLKAVAIGSKLADSKKDAP